MCHVRRGSSHRSYCNTWPDPMSLCLQFVAVEKLEALGVNKGAIMPHAMSSLGGPVRFLEQGVIDTFLNMLQRTIAAHDLTLAACFANR